jgi:hypothetical protein
MIADGQDDLVAIRIGDGRAHAYPYLSLDANMWHEPVLCARLSCRLILLAIVAYARCGGAGYATPTVSAAAWANAAIFADRLSAAHARAVSDGVRSEIGTAAIASCE